MVDVGADESGCLWYARSWRIRCRYSALDRCSTVRDAVLLEHISFLQYPTAGACPYGDQCVDAAIVSLLSSQLARFGHTSLAAAVYRTGRVGDVVSSPWRWSQGAVVCRMSHCWSPPCGCLYSMHVTDTRTVQSAIVLNESCLGWLTFNPACADEAA